MAVRYVLFRRVETEGCEKSMMDVKQNKSPAVVGADTIYITLKRRIKA